MSRSELLYRVEIPGADGVYNARCWVRSPGGDLLALFDAPSGGAGVAQPVFSGSDGYFRVWVELEGTEAVVTVDSNDGGAVWVDDPAVAAIFDEFEDRVGFVVLEGHSHFVLRARGDGTLAVTKIVATTDHGDSSDLTVFIAEHADEPAIAGGSCEWRADGIITLTIDDPDETRQDTMRGFLYLCLMSGRFEVPAEVQALIFPPPP